MSYIVEPKKRIPVVYEADVVVAGAGVAGVFAAIAAARYGAETVLIDRFGCPGGNIGPGMINGGNLSGWPFKRMLTGPIEETQWFMGIPKEFIDRYGALGGGSLPPFNSPHYIRDSYTFSYLALKMLKESGVKLLLSTYVTDPIMEGNRVCGVFVENKTGRQAVKADVVVDDTGEADIARRAGVPVLHPKPEYHAMDVHAPGSLGLCFFLRGVNWEKYELFKKEHKETTKEDSEWAKEVEALYSSKFGYLLNPIHRYPKALIPLLCKAWKNGDFQVIKDVDGLCPVVVTNELHRWPGTLEPGESQTAGGRFLVDKDIALGRIHRIIGADASNGLHISKLEEETRIYIFEAARFWRKYVPGFAHSYLSSVAPFLGCRGGPCIEGEYTLSVEDMKEDRRFPDVVYIYSSYYVSRFLGQKKSRWVDVPYRVMLPKKLDGLVAVGRSISCIPDTLLRARVSVLHNGQVGGTAAALATKNGVTPRKLDVKELQETLLDAGFYLGDRERLKELGLA